jgi:hypothetical protein
MKRENLRELKLRGEWKVIFKKIDVYKTKTNKKSKVNKINMKILK